MQLLRFLNIIQRIIILLVVIGFFPLTFFVFLSHQINISTQQINTYQNLYQQIASGFIIKLNNIDCSVQMAIQINHFCFQYCKINQTCQIIDTTYNCNMTMTIQQKHNAYGHKYCSQIKIVNELNSNNSFELNSSKPPLFNITKTSQGIIKNNYYVYNGLVECEKYIALIGYDIQKYTRISSANYLMALKCLYFTLIPILFITILSIILQIFTRYNFKKTMQISLFNSSIITISIIIVGILFDLQSSQFQNTLRLLGQKCLINVLDQAEEMRSVMLSDITNGLDTGFTIIMGIVGSLQLLLMIALFVVWVIEFRMLKLRKQDHSSNYELQTL